MPLACRTLVLRALAIGGLALSLLGRAALAAPQGGTAGGAGDAPPAAVSNAFSDKITVTADRALRRLADTPEAVTVLFADDLSAGAATTVDQALRQVPGFSLFRRTDSRFANPTTQGASLRGLSSSGASRALVFADGVPLNDPFGGWIAWGRVPRGEILRLTVLSGAASDLYGSAALGGGVDLARRRPPAQAPPAVVGEVSYGELRTGDATLYAGGRRGAWGASAAAEGARTGGYVAVPEPARGAVDTPVAAGTTVLPDRGERAASPRVALRVRASDRLSLSASAYRGFRAPTLNELYRTFRVGNVVTLANPDLAAERLGGGEVGALYASSGGRLTARATRSPASSPSTPAPRAPSAGTG